MGPAARQDLAQLGVGLFREGGQGQAQFRGAVGGEHAGTATIGDDGDAVTAQAFVGAEDMGGGEELVQGIDLDRPGAFHDGAKDLGRADPGAGVGLGGAGARRHAARLDHDHWLDAGGGAQAAHEAAGIADALDI